MSPLPITPSEWPLASNTVTVKNVDPNPHIVCRPVLQFPVEIENFRSATEFAGSIVMKSFRINIELGALTKRNPIARELAGRRFGPRKIETKRLAIRGNKHRLAEFD